MAFNRMKSFVPLRVTEHQDRWCREVVKSLSLKVFKTQLNVDLDSLL